VHDPKATASALVAAGKGILAADESNGTITKRFERLGIESTPETRRDYREMLCTNPGLLEDLGILPGIKVDTGAKAWGGKDAESGLAALGARIRSNGAALAVSG
jgi:fructose-bisphosphate aldolase class I